MSRGFVREDDQEEPVLVPPRAPLPAGFANLVTPRGHAQLLAEKAALENRRNGLDLPEGAARRREMAEINGRLALLEERIASARLVEPDGPAVDVRFGTTVTFRITAGPQQGSERTFTLVGVDEAKVAEGRMAYTAPVAQALMGKKPGANASFKLGDQVQQLQVVAVVQNI